MLGSLRTGSLLWIQVSSWFLTLKFVSYFPTGSAMHFNMFLYLILHFRDSGPGRFPWTYSPNCLQNRHCISILHLFSYTSCHVSMVGNPGFRRTTLDMVCRKHRGQGGASSICHFSWPSGHCHLLLPPALAFWVQIPHFICKRDMCFDMSLPSSCPSAAPTSLY